MPLNNPFTHDPGGQFGCEYGDQIKEHSWCRATEAIDQIKKEILSLLEERGGGLTFVNLEAISGFTGPLVIGLGNRNIVYWLGVSSEACAAIQSLLDAELIDLDGTSQWTYLADGKCPNLPMVTNSAVRMMIKDQNWTYKKPRWLPMAINKGRNYRKGAAV